MPHSEEEDTVRYYDKNAAAYFDETAHLDMSDLRRRFTDLLPEGARILDAGCGSGRDGRVGFRPRQPRLGGYLCRGRHLGPVGIVFAQVGRAATLP